LLQLKCIEALSSPETTYDSLVYSGFSKPAYQNPETPINAIYNRISTTYSKPASTTTHFP
jgi:hypothetical protein